MTVYYANSICFFIFIYTFVSVIVWMQQFIFFYQQHLVRSSVKFRLNLFFLQLSPSLMARTYQLPHFNIQGAVFTTTKLLQMPLGGGWLYLNGIILLSMFSSYVLFF